MTKLDWEGANAKERGQGGIPGKLSALTRPGDPREKFSPSFTQKRGVATNALDSFVLASESWQAERAAKKAAKKKRKAERRRMQASDHTEG
jgi:hypothetical protein